MTANAQQALGRPLTDDQLAVALRRGRVGVVREAGHTLYSAGLVKHDRPSSSGLFYYALPGSKDKLELGKVLSARNKIDAALLLGVPKKIVVREAGYRRDGWKGRGYSEARFLGIVRRYDPRSVLDQFDRLIAQAAKEQGYDTVILQREATGLGSLATEVVDLSRVKTNPKKRKKKTIRKAAPEWQRLIRRCQKLWDHYCERPGKKRLQAVLDHLETMKASKSKKVASERRRCLRVANVEAKRLKLK